MQITSVNYTKLQNLGNYENQKIGASAQVQEGETPEEALAKLKEWVRAQLGDFDGEREKIRQLEQRRYSLQREVARLGRQMLAAKAAWQSAKAILEAHGVKVEEEPRWDYTPFDDDEQHDDDEDEDEDDRD